MPDPFFIGIDGGGSQSTILIMNNRNKELKRIKKGPTNPFSIGIDATESVLSTSIKELIKQEKYPLSNCKGICVGSAGIHHPRDAENLKSRLQNHFPKTAIHITNDYEIALVGGTAKLEGIIIISGTGSVAYGRSKKHKFVRAGGLGHLIGDEGSAYYIGKQALISIFKTYDNNKKSLMEKMVLASKNCKDLDDLMFWTYKLATKKDIADLSIIVDLACKKGDTESCKILFHAGLDLVKLLDNIRKRLRFTTKTIPMLLSGGVLTNNEIVKNTFLKRALDKYPDILLMTAEKDAAYGAALLAKNFQNKAENN